MTDNFNELTGLFKTMRRVCKLAWKAGMMSGWSGNASTRLGESPDLLLITGAGCPKGSLKLGDCLVLNMAGAVVQGSGHPSSETAMHLELYKACPQCQAVLHTHPVNMQALEIALNDLDINLAENFLALPLFEAEMWRPALSFAEKSPPGTAALAAAAAKALNMPYPLPRAVWLPAHGLCSLGKDLAETFYLVEELEHLAAIQLKSMSARGKP